MGKRRRLIRDKKERGEWVESIFLMRATELSIPVCKPWGDSRHFDFVVGRPRRFRAVQVKCTVFALENGEGYICSVCSCHRPYPPGSFDFLAAYVIPEDAWYIIPEREIRGLKSISLCTQASEAKYEKYREAWHLLEGPEEKIDLQACAEEECEEVRSVMMEPRSALPTFARLLGMLVWRKAVDSLYSV